MWYSNLSVGGIVGVSAAISIGISVASAAAGYYISEKYEKFKKKVKKTKSDKKSKLGNVQDFKSKVCKEGESLLDNIKANSFLKEPSGQLNNIESKNVTFLTQFKTKNNIKKTGDNGVKIKVKCS